MSNRRPAVSSRTAPRGPLRERMQAGYLVFADDLTGAGDTAIALAGAGAQASVYLDALPARFGADAVTVAAVDLHTRDLPVEEACEKVAAAAARAPAGPEIYKKIDSTLRGHIGAELAALCRSLADRGAPPQLCIVAPAFPAMGRTLEGGVLHLHGKPVDAAALWGTAAPASRGVIAEELRAHGFACTSIHLPELRAASEAALAARLAATLPGDGDAAGGDGIKPRAVVCDAVSAEDLLRIVRAARALPARCIWVGSAGLAQALAECGDADAPAVALDAAIPTGLAARDDDARTGPEQTAAEQKAPEQTAPEQKAPHRHAARALAFVVGSFSAVAAEQVRRLAESGLAAHIPMPVEELLGEISATTADLIETCLHAGRDVVLSIPRHDIRPELAPRLSAGMARVAQAILPRAGALVCCGGDTSRAILRRIGARCLRVQRCAEPGATLAWCDARPDMPLIMKAGAFGDADALIRLHQELRTLPPAWSRLPSGSHTLS